MSAHDEPAGAGSRFPPTRLSAVVASRSPDPALRARAHGALVAMYWKPVYTYVRLRWKVPREDAEDLTQGFFARAIEKGIFERYEPSRAAFRTYLRTCLDGFVSNERKAARRQKRSAGAPAVPLDFESAEGELRRIEIRDDANPEELFQREWTRSLFGLAVDALRRELEREGKSVQFVLFERYDLDPGEPRPTYARLAEEVDLPVTQVTNFLAAVRRRFRRVVLDRIRETTGSEEEFRAGVRQILGVDPP